MMIRLLSVLLICAAVLTGAGGAVAQIPPNGGFDNAQIEALVQRAQKILDDENATLQELEQIRTELASLRDTASKIVSAGSVEARAVQARIDALGPKPAEGSSEAEDIAARREELNNELAVANRPIREANEALKQANFLVGEVDQTIREKGAAQLLTRLPSPLLPSSWAVAMRDIQSVAKRFSDEAAQSLASEDPVEDRSSPKTIAVFSGVIGLLLIFVVQPFIAGRLDRTFERRSPGYRRWYLAALSGLTRLALPWIGTILLLIVIPLLGISTYLTDLIGSHASGVTLIIVVGYWLGHTVFAPTAPSRRMLPLGDTEAARGVWLFVALGMVAAAEDILEYLQTNMTQVAGATFTVMSLPVFVFSGIALWRIAATVRHAAENARSRNEADAPEAAAEEEEGSQRRISGYATFLIVLLRLAAVLPVLATLAGFLKLAQHLADAMVMTLLLLGLALFLYNLILLAVEELTGGVGEEDERLPLLPIVVIFLLGLAVLPLLALAWGARTTDIAETWLILSNGIRIGDATLSLNGIVTLVLVFAIGLLATRWLQKLLRDTVLPRTRLDIGARSALTTGVGYAGFTIAALIAVSAAGLNLSSLAWIVGALSLGIGFGLQTIVSNFVSGIILLIERPIKEGDWIEVSGYSGTVRKIAVRSTRIETFDRHDVIVPNQDMIANPVKNMTLTNKLGRLIVPVGVAYGSDLEATHEILTSAAAENPDVLSFPAPQVLFIGLGDSSLNFELRCQLRDIGTIMTTQSDLLFRIYGDLGRAGIEIPFPQRDLHLRDIDRLVEAISGRREDRIGDGADRADRRDEPDAQADGHPAPVAGRTLPDPGGPDPDGNDPDGDQV